eukprot:1158510-Pelagomonas_calceolata.AAC.6
MPQKQGLVNGKGETQQAGTEADSGCSEAGNGCHKFFSIWNMRKRSHRLNADQELWARFYLPVSARKFMHPIMLDVYCGFVAKHVWTNKEHSSLQDT